MRKGLLGPLFTSKPTHDLLVVDGVPEVGLELYRAAVKVRLEGLCAKRGDSVYLPGGGHQIGGS